MRQGPSTDTPEVTTVKHGSYVKVLAYDGEWAEILTSGGNRGYLKIKYLMLGEEPETAVASVSLPDPTETPPPSGGEIVYETYAATATEETPMRKQPDAGAAKLGTLPAGAELTVYAYNDDWAYAAFGPYKGFVLRIHLAKVIE
ncbi:MAG: Bacterial SH3 domain protein [Firmicutes bacterium ADurb.Bin467]|nr:MAG: Bacterial SH3 domain protein [Firmicutes bacterium ADurb.Bin467]